MTRNPVKNAWLDVGDELEAIALKLKLHLEQESSEDEDDGFIERLGEKIEAAIGAAEHAAGDGAVRDDLRETGRRLVDAMSITYREASRSVRRHVPG
jgi:hypothetical protein